MHGGKMGTSLLNSIEKGVKMPGPNTAGFACITKIIHRAMTV